jgi:hypothetical protein
VAEAVCLSPNQDALIYRIIMNMSLDPERNWWAKLTRFELSLRRQTAASNQPDAPRHIQARPCLAAIPRDSRTAWRSMA